ncbi:unnamed protein product [Phaeothamnion confervicola]
MKSRKVWRCGSHSRRAEAECAADEARPHQLLSLSDRLCPELLQLCLEFLKVEELCRTATTSKELRIAAYAPTIWRRLCTARWPLPLESHFRDDVTGLDFHRLYQLIGEYPQGFDLSTVKPADELAACGTTELVFNGTVGLGNRCVRTDKPFPPTARPPHHGPLDAAALAALRWFVKVANVANAGSSAPGSPRSAGFAAAAAAAATAATAALTAAAAAAAAAAAVVDRCCAPQPIVCPVALSDGRIDVSPRLTCYFEVSVLPPKSPRHHAVPDCIAVGLTREGFKLGRKMPGWDRNSYGFHSDDGGVFHDAGSMVAKFGPSFGAGDVVGCGISYTAASTTADIFYTLNGRWLGVAFRGVEGTFYPTVGIDSSCPVRINVGATPFAFDLCNYAEAHRQQEIVCWGLSGGWEGHQAYHQFRA